MSEGQNLPGDARGVVAPRQPTRQRIQDAALQLFAAKGFFATGIREIADWAGVTTAALYHYMGSKDELLIEIMVSSMTKLIHAAQESLATADEPAAELAALVRAHVGYHALAPLQSMVNDDELRAVSGAPRARIMQLRDSYEKLWAASLERGLSSGVFHMADPKTARLALLEMCNGVDRWYSSAGPMGPGEVADAFADLALAMVDARRNGRPLRLSNLACAPTEQVLKIVQRALQGNGEGE